jgi:hypothetical protein
MDSKSTIGDDDFYWTNRGKIIPGNPSQFVGTMTPSMFKWTKQSHLYDVLESLRADVEGKIPVLKCGEDEYSILEFLGAIAPSKMWIFNDRNPIGVVATPANTKKAYWINRGEVIIDYPSQFIGTATPTMFKWTKQKHLYDIMDSILSEGKNDVPVVKCGDQNYTALQFLSFIAATRGMWTFESVGF